MTPTTVAAPLDLPCGTTLKNRLVKASTSEGLAAASWGPSNQHLDLYRRWADGGAGLVITGAVMVDAEHRADPDSVVVTDDRHLDKLRAWATAGTANDTELWMQIDHPGRQSPRSINKFPVAPSAVPMSGRIARYFGEPRELTVSDIEMLVWRFGYTALIARETGFTGVQIQAGHGNLISEFLSPASNLRTDEYGGDLDGRMRVLLDVYRAVREQVGESFPVSVKINSTDGIPGGFSEDESLEVAKKLSEIGVDVIEISGGTYVEPLMQGDEFDASGATGEIFFGDHARRVHEAIDTPVMVTGGFRCAADIEKGLEEGMGDLIGMARPMVLIPELANEIIVHGSRERVRLPRLTTHLNSLDDVTESLVGTAWYQMQMDRITDGRSIGGDGLAALWTVAKRHGVRSVLPRGSKSRRTTMPDAPTRRAYDVVLLGATGFAGGLTADYLAANLPEGGRLGLAGRNRDRLEAVRGRLAGSGREIGLLHADATDPSSLADVARSTKVVVSTVGPYLEYGAALVGACAEAGTDYVDLTGEPEFVDRMFLENDATARATGARLVHSCGFDSVPHDLGVLYTVRQLPQGVPTEVRGVVRTNAEFSAGTLHSALTQMSRLRPMAQTASERRRVESQPVGRRSRLRTGWPRRDRVTDTWLIPLPTIDGQVVVRSALAREEYGPEFTYTHNAGAKRFRTVPVSILGFVLGVAAIQVPRLRRAVAGRFIAGEGPSQERRDGSWFTVDVVGTAGGRTVHTRVSGGDPGYTETATMLAESALSLAFDDNPDVAGQQTTAAAMGDNLIDRLTAAGISFETLS